MERSQGDSCAAHEHCDKSIETVFPIMVDLGCSELLAVVKNRYVN